MFSKATPHPLVLHLSGKRYEFASTQDFAFALAGRAGVPGSKITALVKLSTVALHREAEAIRQIEQLFNGALDGVLNDVTSIGPFLQDIDPNSISQDHDWRELMAALNQVERPFEEFKKVALVKYVQYLAARREAITAIYTDRQTGNSSDSGAEVAGIPAKMRETAIFNVAESGFGEYGDFSRMPKGETIEFSLAEIQEIVILIATHPCRLKHADKPVFMDDAGQETHLHSGRNIVGRDPANEVVIDANYRDISRRHLIVEVEANSVTRLTDISSHGTSVPSNFLDNTSI